MRRIGLITLAAGLITVLGALVYLIGWVSVPCHDPTPTALQVWEDRLAFGEMLVRLGGGISVAGLVMLAASWWRVQICQPR